MKKFIACLLVLVCFIPFCLAEDDYTLSQVVVFSRHNIRSPLSGAGSVVDQLTPHTWFNWTSGPSELSLRGGIAETIMGQYFRKYLVSQGLIPDNWIPEDGQVRFYTNSKQRTIATATYFAAGMLPVADVDIEYHCEFDTMDPVFTPQLTFISDAFLEQAQEETKEIGHEKELVEYYALLEDVLDFADSPYAKENGVAHFNTDDTVITFELNKEPAVQGGLSLASRCSDALILQYYEEADPVAAAFGHELTEEQWSAIAAILDTYYKAWFGAPCVSINIAHSLLTVLRDEMTTEGRIFTFLCGHDTNLLPMLSALRVKDYYLPESLCRTTPIGVKFTIEKWVASDGTEYATVSLIYQSTDQLRNCTLLNLDTPPMRVYLEFEGLETNADGMYRFEDVLARFDETIAAYDELPKDLEAAA